MTVTQNTMVEPLFGQHDYKVITFIVYFDVKAAVKPTTVRG